MTASAYFPQSQNITSFTTVGVNATRTSLHVQNSTITANSTTSTTLFRTTTSSDTTVTTTTQTQASTITSTITCSTVAVAPTNIVQNPNFDTNYQNNAVDPPWTLSGTGTNFYNAAQYAQSPPILALLGISSGSADGSVSQVLTGYDTSIPYTLSTFFRPYTLYPQPYDTTVPQHCDFTIAWGSKILFTRSYTQANGTQSGYSFVQFNRVMQTEPNAAISFRYTCPDGYIGNGIADFFIDTVSVRPAVATRVQCGA